MHNHFMGAIVEKLLKFMQTYSVAANLGILFLSFHIMYPRSLFCTSRFNPSTPAPAGILDLRVPLPPAHKFLRKDHTT
jgi:hypothetical protein